MTRVGLHRSLILCLLLAVAMAGCATPPVLVTSTPQSWSAATAEGSSQATRCPVTEPAWVKPPQDAAVLNEPQHGHYYVNDDRSMWASAWWTGRETEYLRASEEGVKVGWYRPAGAALEIMGQRLDAQAPPLDAHVPCCYPTRFQATGLFFPTEGCWQVTARAADRELAFVVWVEP